MSLITTNFLSVIWWRALSVDEEKRLLEIDSTLKNIDTIYPIDKKEFCLPVAAAPETPIPNSLKGILE
jgi:hypothetical protein